MLIAWLGLAALVSFFAGGAFGMAHGERMERRRLWRRMLNDRTLGHEVLEELAKAHGAKLELTELS